MLDYTIGLSACTGANASFPTRADSRDCNLQTSRSKGMCQIYIRLSWLMGGTGVGSLTYFERQCLMWRPGCFVACVHYHAACCHSQTRLLHRHSSTRKHVVAILCSSHSHGHTRRSLKRHSPVITSPCSSPMQNSPSKLHSTPRIPVVIVRLRPAVAHSHRENRDS